MAELLRVLRQPPLGRVGEERGHLGAACRQCSDREAEGGAAQPRAPGAPPILFRHPQRALDRLDLLGFVPALGGDIKRLANCEQADPTASVVTSTPSRSSGMPKVSRDWPVSRS